MVAEKEETIKCYILRESSLKTEKLVAMDESFSSPEKKGNILTPSILYHENSIQSEQLFERTSESVYEQKICSIAAELHDF